MLAKKDAVPEVTSEQQEELIRVLLVDDQKLIRSGFRLICSLEPDLEVVAEASDGAGAVCAARELTPDVVLMDVQMPGMDGIAATEQIVAMGESKVIILTTFDHDDYVFDGLRAGASGFLLKNTDAEHLVEAIRRVAHGDALLAPEVTRRVIEQMTGHEQTKVNGVGLQAAVADLPQRYRSVELLTPREREVLILLAQGLSNAEIAARLYLGEATVKTHVSNCLAKAQVRDRVQAVVFAYESGLIRPGEWTPESAGVQR
ncbi:response regulator [Dermatophilus congolensis]|uniref:response regulator n=1 Tax=Dermatophilus congolensis TaxID=1863 RepID=UPI001AAF67AA|nr:response regulator transcription factor [Dermatophilus congolensis]MBO3143617.1 response regulator transcription factor [Dermatophilus congolensis]MBO3152610.1 response regulator transcription factor [Dermatophilus congolensis]MBO3160379.1 response regulator transcription factor [Dermatophilus congolensis]MBO3163894.1 response regulator transcription factor [Dermatophilus congolensis]MBO3177441.1 response regulator transcription factor [Dermatophilus congolensis]